MSEPLLVLKILPKVYSKRLKSHYYITKFNVRSKKIHYSDKISIFFLRINETICFSVLNIDTM